MKARAGTAALGLLLLGAFAGSAAGTHPSDLNAIVGRAGPAVVNIQAIRSLELESLADLEPHRDIPDFLERFFGGETAPLPDALASGSGFIVSASGLVVTNRHVVHEADEIRVRLPDRREFTAEVVGQDAATDIALLRIPGSELPVVEIGHSDAVAVGDWVVAIGSPFNFENSVTAGIVSAKGRSFQQQQYVPFLQTDVPINRGNSGGPLLDLDGRVVGVNSQIFTENGSYMGLSFSIPIEIAMAVVEQLRRSGRVERGLLGVGIEDVTRDMATALGLAEPAGAIVTTVEPGSAAAEAGIVPWDVIVALDGEPIRRFSELPPRIGLIRPGTPARLDVFRDGQVATLTAVIGHAPRAPAPAAQDVEEPAPPAAEPPPRLGLRLAETRSGLEIEDIEWAEAWRAGLRRGDRIKGVNRRAVTDADSFDAALAAAGGGPVVLLVGRGSARTFVVLGPGAP